MERSGPARPDQPAAGAPRGDDQRALVVGDSRQASIAKLVATDAAMKVTTDAVQVLGGYGYTRDFPVERFMREAKVMQIFEGTCR
ncbi:MAG TPA: acyl-CoA dehydrogenase family protein [Anaerolineales bacterium]